MLQLPLGRGVPGTGAVRPLARPELSYRARRILYAVVSEYIATGEPVGSRRLSKRYGLNLSPATIRNELSDLDEAGCLTQPHTSAGRVPTELGFRVFIDALVQMRDVSAEDRAAVLARMKALRPGADDVVREAGRMLASLTGAAAVVTRPRTEAEALSQIRFIPLSPGQVLAVIVLRSGAIQNRVVTLPEPIDASELERVHVYLAELGTDRTLGELREAVARALGGERGDYELLRRRAMSMLDATVRSEQRTDDVVIEGQGVLFDRPEFHDAEKIRGFLKTFEERERLLDLLDRTLAAGGVTVLVGSEANLVDAPDVGVISANYSAHGVTAGALGVIGPTRMDYAKLMPLVGFTAQVMSDVLAGRSAEEGDDEDDED